MSTLAPCQPVLVSRGGEGRTGPDRRSSQSGGREERRQAKGLQVSWFKGLERGKRSGLGEKEERVSRSQRKMALPFAIFMSLSKYHSLLDLIV